MGADKEAIGDWFSDDVVRVVSDGLSTHFRHDLWCGPTILRVRFRRLFQLSLQVDGKVGDLGHWEGGDWVWDFSWRPLFVWEMDLLDDLLVVASRVSRVTREDVWFWTHSPIGHYSVKLAYSNLIKGLPASGIHAGVVLQAVSRVWTSWAPSKVVVFSWQLLLDRIPTRSNLIRWGVPLPTGGVGWGVFLWCCWPSGASFFFWCTFFFRGGEPPASLVGLWVFPLGDGL